MNAYRGLVRRAIAATAAVLAISQLDAAAHAGRAQGRLDARYTASLGGLPVGRGSWVVDIGEDRFSAAASGATAGLLQIFASGHGESAARGTVSAGQPIAATFVSSLVTDQKSDEVRMVISSGIVKEYVAMPPNAPSPDRIPITEAHRRGIIDPMTASLLRIPGSGEPFVPQACQRTLSIFDGRLRYDLHLGFKRLDHVQSEKGYQGPVVVCSVRFLPIAGHVPARAAIRYLTGLRDIEAWLAPIAGTRVMVPYRISVPTPVGTGVLQATQFVSLPQPGKASLKTQ